MSAIVKVISGVSVRARAADKYVDATALCKAGNKKWSHYDAVPGHHEYREIVARKAGIPAFQLVQKRRGHGGGTWIHPDLAIHLCMWISPEFAAQVTDWIQTLFTDGRVELAPAAIPAQPAPSGFVAVDPDDPVMRQLAVVQQMTAALMQSRERELAIMRGQEELKRQVAEARATDQETRALVALANNTARAALNQSESNHGFFTVLGYARLRGREMPLATAAAHGKKLTAICSERGIRTGHMTDPRFGVVNTYPESLLAVYFSDNPSA